MDLKLTCELKLNKYEDALNTINNLFKVKTVNLELLFVKCDILEKLDKKEELLENYDKILDIDNQNDVILFKKSKLLFDLSYYEDAFKVIQEAIKINPLDEYSLLKKSIEEKLATKIDGKTYDDALSYFSEHEYFVAKEIVSDFDDAPSIELKCRCLCRLGEYDNALTAVNELLNKQNNASNLNLKAKIYLAMHDEENSIKFFKSASQLSKDYLTNLAFAYAAFGNIEASKEIYSKMDCELADIWLKYYGGDDGLIISRLQNDFFNYPHLCCLKVDLYLKKAINFLQNYQNKDGLKYLKLSKKYLDKLIVFINNYKLNKKFVSSNFIYLGELLNKYFVNKKYNPNISRQLMDILKLIMDYYEVESSMLSNNDELYDYYLNVAKLYLSLGYKDAALTSFKLASNYVNSDGELWLYIANLSDENKLVFYNKALFCFEKDLELKYDDNSKKLKGVSLFYLNRKNEAINLIKNLLPSRYDDVKVKNYINDLNKNYSGGF